jgi:hypothetical protein
MVEAIVQGYDGYVGLGIQATLGTGVAATKFQRVTEASITYKEPQRSVVDHIQKNRAFVDIMRGGVEVNGSMGGYLTPDEIFGGIGWAMLLGGSNTVSGSAGVGFTHVFNEAGALPNVGATVEVYEGGSAVMFDMIGMFLNKLSLTVGANEATTFASDWIGVSEALGGTVSTAVFNDDPPFEGWMASLTYGTTLAASQTTISLAQTVNFSYDNKLEPVKGLGSRYMVGRKVGRQEVLLDFTKLLQNDVTIYNFFKNNTQNALTLTLTHDSLAGTSSGAYQVKIELPKVFYKGDAPALTSSDALELPMKAQALYDSTAGFVCRVTIVNSESGTYTVTA